MPDPLDAYIFVKGLDRTAANRLRRLVDNVYRGRVGLNPEDDGTGDPNMTQSDATYGDAMRNHIRAVGGAVVRAVWLLAGVHDAMVAVSADSYQRLQDLLMDDIRTIVSDTVTAVALYPQPPQPMPQPGGNVPQTNVMQPLGMYGASWHPRFDYRALIHGFIQPGSDPTSVLNSFKSVTGANFGGASYVTGDSNFLGVASANDFNTLTQVLNSLPQVQGIAPGSFVSLNVTRT